jgi:hypothetical protein
MKPKWRHVAERAYNAAHGIEDISAAMMPALYADCQNELPPRFVEGLRKVCESQEGRLFKDDSRALLENLRQDAGNGLGRHVLDNVVRLSQREELSVYTAVKAFENALTDRLAKNNRQMEEHTLRKTTVSKANKLRSRLEQAASHSKEKLSGLSRQVLRLDNSRPSRNASKRGGLDDGPNIK